MLGPAPIVPRDFEMPMRVVTEEFVVVPLAMAQWPQDFDSYMASVDHLQSTFDLDGLDMTLDGGHGERWPAGSNIEFAVVDAAWCQFEWQHLRTSFTYTALSLDEREQLAAGYIFRSKKQGYELECQTWIRASKLTEGFDQRWYEWFRNWVETAWPFSSLRIAWPGREISWSEWNDLPWIGWNAEDLT